MPDKSTEKARFARVVEARLVPPLTYIIRFPNGEKIGPWKSSVAADEVAEVINSAHEKTLTEARKEGFDEAQKGFLMHCNQCGVDVVMTTEQKLTSEQQSCRALRGNE